MDTKHCAICEKPLNLLSNKFTLENDERLCFNCGKKIGLKRMGYTEQDAAKLMTSAQVREFIDEGRTIKARDYIRNYRDQVKRAKESMPESNSTNSTDPANAKLDEIRKQMVAAGVQDIYGTKKEIRALPEILTDDEVVKFATSGFYNDNTVLIVCTNKRILFIDKGMFYGIKSSEIPLDMINSVSYQKKLLLGSVTVTDGAGVSSIDSISKEDTVKLANVIKAESENYKRSLRVPSSAPQPAENNDVEHIRQLKGLLDDGIITQDEFDAKKKQILGL